MPVEPQRPEIAALGRGRPDRRKVIVREQPQQQLRVAPIMFLSPRLSRANRGRMARAGRDAQLLHQPHEPAYRSRGFDPNDDGRGQA
jgi:hypothetical protein